ncbi:MAG TPA: STAS domain-containing protein [Bryobacteraceae bacterium]|nr:STAS domain-containing protein [Bryobacteraceae bacterium]
MEPHSTQDVNVESLAGSRDDIRIIKLRGPLMINNFFAFQDLARRQPLEHTLLIDLADVPYIDSAALGSLIGIHVSCERAGRKYALVGANARLKNLFTISGVDQFLVTYPTIAEAESGLG